MPNYEKAAERAARRYGLNPKIFKAMIRQESGFNPSARSGAGAQGIAQFMPATAREYGVNLNDNRASDDLDGAARYLKANLDKYGSYHKALSVYNSGRPDAYKDPSFADGQTYNYVRTIMAGAKTETGTRRSVRTPSAPSQSPQGSPAVYSLQGGVDNSDARKQAAAQYFLNSHDPGALIAYKQQVDQLQDVDPSLKLIRPGMAPQPTTGGKRSKVRTSQTGTAKFEGHEVAAWIAPALRYARKHGWKGQVNSGFRSYEDQKRIYDSGVRPAALPGHSNHEGSEYPRGAVDVSDAEQLARILLRSPWRKKLIYAGSKDPVHFSHPHGGSY